VWGGAAIKKRRGFAVNEQLGGGKGEGGPWLVQDLGKRGEGQIQKGKGMKLDSKNAVPDEGGYRRRKVQGPSTVFTEGKSGCARHKEVGRGDLSKKIVNIRKK